MLDLVVQQYQHHRQAAPWGTQGWVGRGVVARKTGRAKVSTAALPSSNPLLVNSSVAKQKSNLTQRIIWFMTRGRAVTKGQRKKGREGQRRKKGRKERRKEEAASSKASMQFVQVSIVSLGKGFASGGARTVRTQIYVSRDTSQNPPQLPRIELTWRLPPSIFLSSARGTLVIPNSLMALDQLSRRPFAQIPVTLPFLSFILSHTCSKIKLSLRIIIEYISYEYKSVNVSILS